MYSPNNDPFEKKASLTGPGSDERLSSSSTVVQRCNVIVSRSSFSNDQQINSLQSLSTEGHSSSYLLSAPAGSGSSSGGCDPPKKTKSKKVVENFVCGECNKTFRHKSYYDYHLRTHTGERPHQCHLCQKAFFERSKLNRHLNFCHNIKNAYYKEKGSGDHPITFNCSKCNKSFSRNSALQTHLLTHDGIQIRPFPCKICGKTFSGLTALKNHEKAHEGTKSIICDVCGKAFLLKKYLDLHLSTTHRQNVNKYCCPIFKCKREFYSAKDLKRHQLIHSNERNFLCKICKTSFKRKDNLSRHLKLTHSLTPDQNVEIGDEIIEVSPNNDKLPEIPKEPVAPPIIRQVSVIKSTHEFIMSMSGSREGS